MGNPKSRAQQFTELLEPVPKDFDPEEDIALPRSDGSGSEDSDDGLAGTEHYATISKSKLRKPEEISLGLQYAGSRISRKALLDEDNGSSGLKSGSEEEESNFADPDELDFGIDIEDGEIDSDAALGESDPEKFENFVFRGSGKPKDLKGGSKRPYAADFILNDSDEEDEALNVKSGDEENDEDILDPAEQHSDDSRKESFSTPRQYADDVSEQSEGSSPGFEGLDNGREEDNEDMVDEEEDSDPKTDHNETRNSDEEEDQDDDDGDGDNNDEDDETSRRAEIRKIMSEEHKTVIATISQAVKADVDKGNAVKAQRKAFDSLLSIRIVLQKALVATNSMATIDENDIEGNEPYEAAEQAAVKLWNTLGDLRNQLSKAKPDSKPSKKRKRGVDVSTSSAKMWDMMKKSEVSMIDARQTTLEKWSAKVRGTASLPLTRKLNPDAAQSITSVLQDQLASSDHLVRKTKIPRSCAPIQRDRKTVEDPNIYDDGTFYQLLLKELVDQRRIESLNAPAATTGSGRALQWTAVKEAKTKKNVDTKASKGRKMRFTVHEKLQNFMAPEDRGSWEPHAIDRFFGTLLGQKMTLGEDAQEEEEEDDAMAVAKEGLKLFRS